MFYTIARRFLRVRTFDEWSAQLISRFFRGQLLMLSSPPVSVIAHHTIEVRTETPPAFERSGLQTFEVFSGQCYTDGESSYLTVDDSLIHTGTLASQLTIVWIGSTEHARRPLSLSNVMSYAMQAALRRCGLFPLHAAGLIAPVQEKGLLVIGESGSGKSTLALQLAAASWRYLSDDSIALTKNADEDADAADGMVTAHGLRRRFAVTDRSLAACALPGLSEALGEHMPFDENKRYLDPTTAFPGQLASSCQPGVLLFPAITNQPHSTVERLSRSAAMVHLATFCPWACYDASTSREHLRVLSGLTRQTNAYLLHAGRDLIEQAGRAASLVNSLCEENNSR